MLEEAGEAILSRLAEDAPEMWREADGVAIPIPTLPDASIRILSIGEPATSPFVEKLKPVVLPKVLISLTKFILALTELAEVPDVSLLKYSKEAIV
jgi:hypothetical protein